jgi:formylglycine-generating enzyme required for sulfatase activity
MARNNYGTLRPGGRRSVSGAWQWVVIGFVVGFGCAAMIGLVMIIGGFDPGGILTASRPTPTAVIITATPLPATPTLEPTEVLLIPTASPTSGQIQVAAPSATPTTDPSTIQLEPSATATTQTPPTADSQSLSSPSDNGDGSSVEIPRLLEGIISPISNVEGGTFQMGTTPDEVAVAVDECVNRDEATCQLAFGEDSAPPHSVTINPFAMETTEVTYAQYLAFLNSMGPNSHRTGCNGQLCIATRAEDPNSNVIFDSANYRVLDVISQFPVAAVTWYGAQSYCEAIGRRLPTEAEWERAARGPQNNLYPWGNTFTMEYAKTSRPRPEDPSLAGAVAVGSYAPGASAYGMLDMAGNVAEWVSDWYSPTYYTQLTQSGQPVLNPQGPPAGTSKVVRGGSWDTVPFFTRSVHRQEEEPQNQTLWLGFRCAQDSTTGGANLSGGGTGAETTLEATAPVDDINNSQPTLPPPPVSGGTGGNAPLATLPAGTLPPG